VQYQVGHMDQPALEDARFIVYEDEREVIATDVSTCDLQKQSHKCKQSSIKRLNCQHIILSTRNHLIKQY